ncbi:hypothetical protein COJ97_15135 [Bacillus cereus]|nr:hypothetical protein COJ97_15135 [Bacillus cereus]
MILMFIHLLLMRLIKMMKYLLIDNINGKIEAFKRLFKLFKKDYDVVTFKELKNIDISEYKGVIISGTSVSPQVDRSLYIDEINFLKKINIPTLAICGGHQILSLSFGGELEEIEPIYGRVRIDVLKKDHLFNNIDNHIYFTKHKFIVKDVPKDFHVLAEYQEEVYVIKHKDKPLYGVQFHPERKSDGEQLILNFFEIVDHYHVSLKQSLRLKNLTTNDFGNLTSLKQRMEKKSYIDMSEGIPDLLPNERIIKMLNIYSKQPGSHIYPTRWGGVPLRASIKGYLERKCYDLDGNFDVFPILGSKEAIAHISTAYLDKDDVVLIPDISYPFYKLAAEFAGALPIIIETDENFIPLIHKIDKEILCKAKLLWLNYPHNPTGALIDEKNLLEIATVCDNYNITMCLDLAYNDLIYTKNSPRQSLLQIGYKSTNIIEIYSLSKSFSIAGWRTGYILSHIENLRIIEKSKSIFDTGMYIGFQKTLRYIFDNYEELLQEQIRTYKNRMDYFVGNLKEIGLDVKNPQSTFYCWVKTPDNFKSAEFAQKLFEESNVLVLPGKIFGEKGNDYIRFSLTQHIDILEEALLAIRKVYAKEGSKI